MKRGQMKRDPFHVLVEALRRGTGARTTYDWLILCDRPVESLTLASLIGERPDGGWRGYRGR